MFVYVSCACCPQFTPTAAHKLSEFVQEDAQAVAAAARPASAQRQLLLEERRRDKCHNDLFMLVQTAMQSGPMSGSKPGKFPKGQERVAAVARVFFDQLAGAESLNWTEAQSRRLAKWRAQAHKRAGDTEVEGALSADDWRQQGPAKGTKKARQEKKASGAGGGRRNKNRLKGNKR